MRPVNNVPGFSMLFLVLWLPVSISVAGDESGFEALYNRLLAAYWHPPVMIHDIETTVFDYAAMARDAKKDGSLFQQTLTALTNADISRLNNPRQKKAFWLNVYNFAAMNLIVDNYPVNSIRSMKISLFKHPWTKKSINVGGNWYSLEEIEKEVLLKTFNDPRIIFAVNCAAVSCPDRLAEAFSGKSVDVQMDNIIRNFFLNQKKGLVINYETKAIKLSWILKKDIHLFKGHDGGIMGFVKPYLDEKQQAWLDSHSDFKLEYFDHDWTLNDLAHSD